MKVLIIVICLLLMLGMACNKDSSMKDKSTEAYLREPFSDLDFANAKSLAIEKKKTLLVLMYDQGSVMENASMTGFDQKKAKDWMRNYLCIPIHVNADAGQSLVQKYGVRYFPAVLRFSQQGKFVRVNYGSATGTIKHLTTSRKQITQQLWSDFQAGDRSNHLLIQLLNHYPALEQDPTQSALTYVQVVNAHFEDKSLAHWKTYEGYQDLLHHYRDIRLDISQVLLENRDVFNQAYQEMAAEKKLKRHQSADFMLIQALRKSYEQAIRNKDHSLYSQCEDFVERIAPNYYDRWIGASQLVYTIQNGDQDQIANQALKYFNHYEEWYYGADHYLMEAGAKAVLATKKDREALAFAERWIDRAVYRRATPTRFAIQIQLLEALGKEEKVQALKERASSYQALFQKMLTHYPLKKGPIALEQGNIKKKAYQKVENLHLDYAVFTSYISQEGSLFKVSEKVEPVALISSGPKEVQLLSRVHLMTTSLLPVTRMRSYYIRSGFAPDGTFLYNQYVQGTQLN